MGVVKKMTNGIRCKGLVDTVLTANSANTKKRPDNFVENLVKEFDSCTAPYDSVIEKCKKNPKAKVCKDFSLDIFMEFINCLGGSGTNLGHALTGNSKLGAKF